MNGQPLALDMKIATFTLSMILQVGNTIGLIMGIMLERVERYMDCQYKYIMGTNLIVLILIARKILILKVFQSQIMS